MEIVGSICAVVALGAFLGIATYEWLLWRKRTIAETKKLSAEGAFYVIATCFLVGFNLEDDDE